MVELAAGRHQPQQLLRAGAQALDPQHQRVAQRRRQRAAPVEPGGQQLLGEQRVALGAVEQARQQIGVRLRAEDVGELLGQLGLRERLELDAAGVGVALQLGEQRAQRVAAVQLVGPVAGDHQHLLAAQRGREVDEERARRAVGPVEVLDRQQQAVLAAEPLEQLQQALEQARLGGRRLLRPFGALALPQAGEHVREAGAGGGSQRVQRGVAGARERAQGGDDRRVGQLALAELDALAAEHAHPVLARGALELAEQPRLADARLAGDERDRRLARARVGQPGLELGQLVVAADERGAGDARRHTSSIAINPDATTAASRGAAGGGGADRGHARHGGGAAAARHRADGASDPLLARSGPLTLR